MHCLIIGSSTSSSIHRNLIIAIAVHVASGNVKHSIVFPVPYNIRLIIRVPNIGIFSYVRTTNVSLVSTLYLINVKRNHTSITHYQLGHVVVLTCVRRKGLRLAVLIDQVLVGRVNIVT